MLFFVMSTLATCWIGTPKSAILGRGGARPAEGTPKAMLYDN